MSRLCFLFKQDDNVKKETEIDWPHSTFFNQHVNVFRYKECVDKAVGSIAFNVGYPCDHGLYISCAINKMKELISEKEYDMEGFFGETDPIMVSAPVMELAKRYPNIGLASSPIVHILLMDIPTDFVGAVVKATLGETINDKYIDAFSYDVEGDSQMDSEEDGENDAEKSKEEVKEEVKEKVKEGKPLTKAWWVLPIPDDLNLTMQ